MSTSNVSPTLDYSCKSCSYSCGSRRMLASHFAAVHAGKVYKCPLCPFVSCYQANFYRHRRIVHKVGQTTCSLCGLECQNLEELTSHKEIEHGQGLEEALNRYDQDKELQNDGYQDSYLESTDEQSHLQTAEALYLSGYGYDALEQNNSFADNLDQQDQVYYSFRNGTDVEFLEVTPDVPQSYQDVALTAPKLIPNNLEMDRIPLKIRRHYNCKDCGLETLDPREFLYHRRDAHYERISVYECPYCIYATKHFQKLQRHCGLVHKTQPIPQNKVEQVAPFPPTSPPTKNARKSVAPRATTASVLKSKSRTPLPPPPPPPPPPTAAPNRPSKAATSRSETIRQPSKAARVPPNIHQCSRCDFQCKSKLMLAQHEKNIHLRRKFFRCLQCGYVTNERGRYTKHVKYHSLPKMKCEQCDFFTTYKWNLDRHMRNHEMEGAFSCGRCSFKTHNRQSLTAHETNHHLENGADINGTMEDDDVEIEEVDVDGDDTEVSEEEEEVEEEGIEQDMEEYVDEEMAEQNDSSDEGEPESDTMSTGVLKCRFCSFKGTSQKALNRHEESHGNLKRYPCPLCGISFDHVAWLARHLTRKHNENTTSKEISKAAKQLKRQRRKYNSSYEIPTRSSRLHAKSYSAPQSIQAPPSPPIIAKSPSPKPSPPPQVVSRAGKSFSSRRSSITNELPKSEPEPVSIKTPRAKKSIPKKSFTVEIANSPKPPDSTLSDSSPIQPFKTNLQSDRFHHTCTICNYKTRWISEMEKHCRVHSIERPFCCPSCKYRCKWKGDLKRHVVKYHDESLLEIVEKMKAPPLGDIVANSTPTSISKKEQKKEEYQSINSPASRGSLKVKFRALKRQSVSESETPTTSSSTSRSVLKPMKLRRTTQQDSPLDLSVAKKLMHASTSFQIDSEDTDSYEDHLHQSSDMITNESFGYEPNVIYSPLLSKNGLGMSRSLRKRSTEEIPSTFKKIKIGENSEKAKIVTKKYKCTFCPFMSRTASRFHVHIVQHLNKKPFMCSVCFYKSNWEWDITKHIKIKSVRDSSHRSATTMITDESGRKNYEKYNRFLVEVDSTASGDEDGDFLDRNCSIEMDESPEPLENHLNYMISPEEVENIVVTPDFDALNTIDNSIVLDLQHYLSPEKSFNTNYFYCKHCTFKHAEKKAVVGHLSVHAGRKPYQCRICGMVSNWKHVILRHVKMRHSGDLKDVRNRLSYILNGNVVQLSGLQDDEISQQTETIVNMETKIHPPTDFRCSLCPYSCEKQCYMQFHMKQHKPRDGANFKCPHCPYWVNFKKTLNRHLKVHEPSYHNTPFDTPAPEIEEEEEPEPQPHYVDYIDAVEEPPATKVICKKYACEHCPYRTDNKRHCLYHKQFHRPNKAALFKCPICSYWSMYKHLISQHLNKCHAGESYTVPVPETDQPQESAETQNRSVTYLGSPSIGESEVVLVTQGGKTIKMFKCRFCPMMNRRRANVRSHEDMHNSNRTTKFSCQVCNYQCNSQGVLTSHMKLHADDTVAVVNKESYDEIVQNVSKSVEKSPSRSPPPSLLPENSPIPVYKRTFSYFCPNCPGMFKSRSDFQTHFSFHGSVYSFACNKCDYRSKHKPHLHKHFLVHTADYMAKREMAEPKKVEKRREVEPTSENNPTLEYQMSSANQMLLLEERETSLFLEKGFGKQTPKVNKCPFCPAAFQKTSILSFHKYLHGINGAYYCSSCNYSVNEMKNLNTHQKLHCTKNPPARNVLKIFACSKCPAVFTKANRYTKHFDLHGKKNKFTCEHCDFSVGFYVNLVKHRPVHDNPPNNAQSSVQLPVHPLPFEPPKEIELPLEKPTDSPQKSETREKTNFCCSRCPYFHGRRDALMKHHRRHTANASIQCPHCDYSSVQASFLRDHIKWHFQSKKLYKAQAYMKYSQLEVWAVEDGKRVLLFKDRGEDKENSKRFTSELEESFDEIDVGNDACEEIEDQSDFPEKELIPEEDIASLASVGLPRQNDNKLVKRSIKHTKKLEVVLTDVFKLNNDAIKKSRSSKSDGGDNKNDKTDLEDTIQNTLEDDIIELVSHNLQRKSIEMVQIDDDELSEMETIGIVTNDSPINSETVETDDEAKDAVNVDTVFRITKPEEIESLTKTEIFQTSEVETININAEKENFIRSKDGRLQDETRNKIKNMKITEDKNNISEKIESLVKQEDISVITDTVLNKVSSQEEIQSRLDDDEAIKIETLEAVQQISMYSAPEANSSRLEKGNENISAILISDVGKVENKVPTSLIRKENSVDSNISADEILELSNSDCNSMRNANRSIDPKDISLPNTDFNDHKIERSISTDIIEKSDDLCDDGLYDNLPKNVKLPEDVTKVSIINDNISDDEESVSLDASGVPLFGKLKIDESTNVTAGQPLGEILSDGLEDVSSDEEDVDDCLIINTEEGENLSDDITGSDQPVNDVNLNKEALIKDIEGESDEVYIQENTETNDIMNSDYNPAEEADFVEEEVEEMVGSNNPGWNDDDLEVKNDMLVDILMSAGVYDQLPDSS